MEEQPNYFATIPANVRYDEDLRANEKLLYGEITALSSKFGECWASNNYFARLYKVTPQAISLWINHLKDKGYITIEYIKKDKVVEKRIIKLGVSTYIDRVSTNVDGGYQQMFKENNTSNNNTGDNKKIIEEYEKEIGVLTPYQYEKLITYTVDLSQEMIIEAIHRASSMNKRNLSYIEAILKNWINNGYKTLGDIKSKEIKHEETTEERVRRIIGGN